MDIWSKNNKYTEVTSALEPLLVISLPDELLY